MLETATGVSVYTISAEFLRFLSILKILDIFAKVWSDIWKIPSLIDDEAISMAIAQSFECLSVSEIRLLPDTTCNKSIMAPCQHSQFKLRINAEDQHSQPEPSINAEQLLIESSKTVASECLSVYGTPERNPSPDSSCNKPTTPLYQRSEFELSINAEDQYSQSGLSTNAEDQHSPSELSINEEQLSIASSKAVVSECMSVYGTPEIKSPLDSTLNKPTMLLYRHSEFELSINAEDQHSESELDINAEQLSIASSKAVASKCLSVFDTPESSTPLDTSCIKATMACDQHSQSKLSINADKLQIASSKAVTDEFLSVDDTHENNSPLDATCKRPTVPLDQHSEFEASLNAEYQYSDSKLGVNGDEHSELELTINAEPLQFASSKVVASEFLSLFETPDQSEPEHNKNEECIATASELPTYASVSKTPDIKEQPKTICNSDDYLITGVSALSPSARVSETLDNIHSPESTYNLPSGTPPAYHLMSPVSQNADSLLMTVLSPTPSVRVHSTQSPERTCNLPISTSPCLFARCFQTPDKNQSPETAGSISLIPLACHSEYKRFTESFSSPESTCSPHLNSLQFQSQSEFSRNAETTLFTVTFNQNFTCFACGTDQGIRVYRCNPFEEVFNGYFGHGGISIVEMYYENKILVFVGSEDNIQCPPDKVFIWDYEFHRCVYELTAESKVQGVKITRDHMVVILEQEICVYNCLAIEVEILYRIETLPNTKGICAVSYMSSNPILACPGLLKGQVHIEHFVPQKTIFLSAHDSHIACLALSKYGAILVTASTKGTLLRIFNTLDGTCLQEVRRGAKRAEIYSISISEIARLLAMCSDKGTVHIVGLNEKVATQEQVARKKSNNLNGNAWRQWNVSSGETSLVLQGANSSFPFSFMKGVPKYFNSDRSFSQFHFSPNVRALVGFGEHNTIMIVGYDGSFYRCEFDPVHGGKMVQKLYKTFF